MSGDCNIYGGFVAGSGGSTEAVWGSISGEISNQTDLIEKLNQKIDKEQGKGLSSNDFTDANKDKLDKLNTILEFSLSPDSWELFNDDIYTQEVLLENIKSSDTVVADISLSENTELSSKEYECWSRITKIEINDGSIKAYYQGELPTIILDVRIKI